MNIATVVKYLVLLRPLLMTLIETAEAEMPQTGAGAAKLEAVKDALNAIWSTIDGVTTDFQSAWPSIQNAVAALVALKNRLGWRKPALDQAVAPAPK